MPPQEIFEFTSFEIVSGAVLGRIFEDVILCIRFTLAGGSCRGPAARFIHSQLQCCARTYTYARRICN